MNGKRNEIVESFESMNANEEVEKNDGDDVQVLGSSNEAAGLDNTATGLNKSTHISDTVSDVMVLEFEKFVPLLNCNDNDNGRRKRKRIERRNKRGRHHDTNDDDDDDDYIPDNSLSKSISASSDEQDIPTVVIHREENEEHTPPDASMPSFPTSRRSTRLSRKNGHSVPASTYDLSNSSTSIEDSILLNQDEEGKNDKIIKENNMNSIGSSGNDMNSRRTRRKIKLIELPNDKVHSAHTASVVNDDRTPDKSNPTSLSESPKENTTDMRKERSASPEPPAKRVKNKKKPVDVSFKGESCGVCFDTFDTRGKLDCCNHMYCVNCITTWSKTSNTCPQCKRRFKRIDSYNLEGNKIACKKVGKKNMTTESSYSGHSTANHFHLLNTIFHFFPSGSISFHGTPTLESEEMFEGLFMEDDHYDDYTSAMHSSSSAPRRPRRVRARVQNSQTARSSSAPSQGASHDNPLVIDDDDDDVL